MSTSSEERRSSIAAREKQLHVEFDNYAQTVTLVSSVEGWVRHKWGPAGEVAPTLETFDRFPQCGEYRPDFLARFRTGYRLCGEVVRTFRNSDASRKDTEQLVAYTHHLKETADGGSCGDVLLLLHPYTDGIAAGALVNAAASKLEEQRPQTPIVIVGYMLDRRAMGEWYDLMWRDQPGNARFSEPNVVPIGEGTGLNDLVTAVPHVAIPVDSAALDVFTSNPLINDDPPPFYAAVVVIIPAINELLSEEDRDELSTVGRVSKRVSRDMLAATECISSVNPPSRYLQVGLDFMVEHGWARTIADTAPPEYDVEVNLKRLQGKDPARLLLQQAARRFVDRILAQRARARRRAAKSQLRLL